MTRLLRLVLFFVALAPAAYGPAALGAEASIKSFYGTFQGSGIANTKDSLYFGITMRDLDVKIGPAGPGFTVEWTTVLRQGGTPDKPDTRRKTSAITFASTKNPRRFKAVKRTDPLQPDGLSWARLKDNTLIVYVLTISPIGKYNLQRYARTISGMGMDLQFSRIKDGAQSRSVKGKLVRIAK